MPSTAFLHALPSFRGQLREVIYTKAASHFSLLLFFYSFFKAHGNNHRVENLCSKYSPGETTECTKQLSAQNLHKTGGRDARRKGTAY